MSDELDDVRHYVHEIAPPDARTIAEVRSRLNADVAAISTSSSHFGRTVRVRWVLALFVVVAISAALLLPSFDHHPRGQIGQPRIRDRLAQLVVDDVNVTVASGNYDMTYNDTTTPPTSQCQSQGGRPEAGSTGQNSTDRSVEPCVTEGPPLPSLSTETSLSSISGHGTVDTNPYAMVTASDVGPLGSITLYDNGTDVWEIGGGDYGLSAPGQAGPGAPLSGYASSVEGTLGPVEGALDMQGLASGTGYLDLEAQEIQGAQPAGSGSVDGVPVTIYRLSESGLQDPDTGGLTPEQVSTIRAADAIIKESGFAGKTTWISVDSNGYIREQKTQYALPDGSMVTGDTVLSNFGCAGTVLMPGQQGTSAAPPGCVSPDHAAAGSSVAPAPGNASTTTTTTSTTQTTTGAGQATTGVVPVRPTALAIGPNGNLYIADQSRNQILERNPDGSFMVVAGTGQVGDTGDGRPAVDAELDRPSGMTFGADGTLFFADEGNNRVRAISPTGIISTVVGTGASSPTSGFVTNGTAALVATVTPDDVALGPGGRLYLSTGEQVLRLNADGTLSIVVGMNSQHQGSYGVGDQATTASADGADDIAFDSAGNLYFFGFDSKSIFVVQPSGLLTEPYGQQSIYPRGDAGLATAPDGGIIAMDELSVVRLSPTGEQTIISFSSGLFHGIRGFSPSGIAIDPDGTIYVDTYYGNGFTDRSAIASISPRGASSQVLWEAPMGQ